MQETQGTLPQRLQELLKHCLRARVWMPIVIGVFALVFVVQAAFIIPASRAKDSELLNRLEAEALRLVKASFDVWSFPSADDMLRILEQNMLISDLRGGWLFRGEEKEGHLFGERPLLTPKLALEKTATRHFDADTNRLDLFVSHEKTALQYDMILRLETTRIMSSGSTDIFAELGRAFLIALISAALTLPALVWLVSRPLGLIAAKVQAAAHNPAQGDKHMLRLSGSDEIGELGRAIDSLLKSTAVIYRQQFESANHYFESCPLAVVELEDDGTLASANDAALDFFRGLDEEALSGIASFPCLFDGDTDSVSLLDSLAAGSYVRAATILVPEAESRAIIVARSAAGEQVGSGRHVVSIVDPTALIALPDQSEASDGPAGKPDENLNRRVFELKQFLESCVSIIGAGASAGPADAQNLETIILDWHKAALASGTTCKDPPIHKELPAVLGSPDGIKSIFRHALTFLSLNSPIDAPEIDIQVSKGTDGKVRFMLLDFQTNLDRASYNAEIQAKEKDGNCQLFVLAIKKLLEAEGGAWLPVDRDKHINCIAFELPAAGSASQARESTA